MLKRLVALVLFAAVWALQVAYASNSLSIIVVNDSVSMTLSKIIAKGLPVLCVETVEGEEPTCEYVSAPAGCMGMSIKNATKVPGRLVIYKRLDNVDSVMYDSGEYENDNSGITIKIRGNTSAYGAKKPYKIKLQKKKDLLFRGDESKYQDKDWLLLKDDYLMATAGYMLSELVGMQWTPAHTFVNLIVNGNYRGVYLLCESVKRNPSCRLDVDKKSGYIFECDPYWWNEDVYVTSITSPSYNFTFKYPDSDDILPEQLDYIQGVVTSYENSLKKTNYPSKIDVESWARWCLAQDILGSKDSGGTNRFYSKRDSTDTSLVVMPLLWDFDQAERTTSGWSYCHIDHFSKLFNNSNRLFVDEYVAQWRRLSATIATDMPSALRKFRSSAEGMALMASSSLEQLRWDFTMNVSGRITDHINWFENRKTWMDSAVDGLSPVGDVNVNGKVTVADITALIDMLLGAVSPVFHAADVNGDDSVDIDDVTILIDMLLRDS